MGISAKKPRIFISGSGSLATYTEAIESNGGIVVTGFDPELAKTCDGLLLSGGCDVNPAVYGAPLDGAKDWNDERDAKELALIDLFTNAKKPILGICRGHQMLNAALGGTLIQDLPANPQHTGGTIHDATAEPNSRIASVYGTKFRVNSYHHEAVDRPAEGFVITARSDPDGVVECTEHRTMPWFSVQFHPEKILQKPDPSVIEGSTIFKYYLSLFND